MPNTKRVRTHNYFYYRPNVLGHILPLDRTGKCVICGFVGNGIVDKIGEWAVVMPEEDNPYSRVPRNVWCCDSCISIWVGRHTRRRIVPVPGGK